MPSQLCVKCKGRLWCKNTKCLVLEKFHARRRAVKQIKERQFMGSSPPGLFVSWNNYPNISIAPLSPTETMRDADLLDNPERWFGYRQEEIASFRESLVRGTKQAGAFEAANPSYSLMDLQDMVLSEKQLDVEMRLFREPRAELVFDDSSSPMGPSAPLDRISYYSHPRVPKRIQDIVYDSDAKSTEAMKELYSSKVPVHSITKMLSAGLLGVQKKRRLVPTRWAITATDDTVSKEMLEKIRDYSTIDYFELYRESYVDNHFWILLLPTKWQFEQLEAWKPGTPWTMESREPSIMQDSEQYYGRTKYADNVTGAYYSARLAVCELLERRKRQAGAIIFREIGSDYRLPLGVWVIRETVREAMKGKPLVFFELGLALKFLEKKLSVPMGFYKKNSSLLDSALHQKTIFDFR